MYTTDVFIYDTPSKFPVDLQECTTEIFTRKLVAIGFNRFSLYKVSYTPVRSVYLLYNFRMRQKCLYDDEHVPSGHSVVVQLRTAIEKLDDGRIAINVQQHPER